MIPVFGLAEGWNIPSILTVPGTNVKPTRVSVTTVLEMAAVASRVMVNVTVSLDLPAVELEDLISVTMFTTMSKLPVLKSMERLTPKREFLFAHTA